MLIYWTLIILGGALIIIGLGAGPGIKKIFSGILVRFRFTEISVTTPLGLSLKITPSFKDREIAWRIYSEIKSRITAVEFNEDYDSFLHVHKSLHELFLIIRKTINEMPAAAIRDDNNQIIELYFSLLNDVIRPYLSKWHIPISHWHKIHEGKTMGSILELEKEFPQRRDILRDMSVMNGRIKIYADHLLKIARGDY